MPILLMIKIWISRLKALQLLNTNRSLDRSWFNSRVRLHFQVQNGLLNLLELLSTEVQRVYYACNYPLFHLRRAIDQ
jgi:hypothetical protein